MKEVKKSKAVQLLEGDRDRLSGAIRQSQAEVQRLEDRAREERDKQTKLYDELHEVERDLSAIERLTGGQQ